MFKSTQKVTISDKGSYSYPSITFTLKQKITATPGLTSSEKTITVVYNNVCGDSNQSIILPSDLPHQTHIIGETTGEVTTASLGTLMKDNASDNHGTKDGFSFCNPARKYSLSYDDS